MILSTGFTATLIRIKSFNSFSSSGAAAATGSGSLTLSAARRSVKVGRLARVLGRGADAASDSNRIIDAYLDGSRYDIAARNTTTETGQRAVVDATPNPRVDEAGQNAGNGVERARNRGLGGPSGNHNPTHRADAGDAFDPRLPGRQTGQPTNGIIDVDGVEVHLQSGAKGPANRWYDPNKPAINQTATHVEGHATALMVDNGITNMTVTINNRTGPCNVCKGQIPNLLPQGSTLNVRWHYTHYPNPWSCNPMKTKFQHLEYC